jgi:hypothetical protein
MGVDVAVKHEAGLELVEEPVEGGKTAMGRVLSITAVKGGRMSDHNVHRFSVPPPTSSCFP